MLKAYKKGRFFLALLFLTLLMPFPPSTLASEVTGGIHLLEEFENTFISIAEKVTPTVVNIAPVSSTVQAPFKRKQERPRRREAPPGSGSGVIVAKDGYIVTNNHVVGDAAEVEVRLSDETKFIGKVIGKDPDTDLAVLKVESDRDLPFASFGDSGKVKVGQWVIAVGNPFGLDRTVTVGVVSALGRENVNLSRYENFIQTDASINPGNSGGPLFNIHGEVVGINTAIINFAQGIGFSIPSNMVQNVMDQLISKGKVVRGWLGVGIQPLTEELAGKFGVKDGEGVLVNEVFEGDPANKAGIEPGDVIMEVNGKHVDTPSTLARVIAGIFPGEKIEVEVVRNGKRETFTLVLAERKEEAVTTSIPQQPDVVLGLNVQDLTPDLAERFEIKKDETGVLITKVEPGSSAEAEGLKEGDLLKEINRKPVKDSQDFEKVISELKENETVLLRILRENRAFFVVLKPQEE